MTLITKEKLKGDSRFYLDDRNIDRLMDKPLLDYKIKRMKVGMILRIKANTSKIVTLNKTRVYAFLKGDEDGEQQYEEYRKLCHNVSFRNARNYNKLITELENTPYNITKGAIVVDQDNLILDGQHRSCILFYRFGPNYPVDVVQFKYKQNWGISRIRLILKLLLAKCQAWYLCNV